MGRSPWLAVAVVAAAAMVIVARGYSSAQVDAEATAFVVAEEGAGSNALLAVTTFAPSTRDLGAVAMLLAAGDPAEEPVEPAPVGPVVCGTVTNNTGHRVVDLAAFGQDDAWGRVTVDRESLDPGRSTDLLCDIDGLQPGPYLWRGEVTGSWTEGSARIRFQVAFEIPDPGALFVELEEEAPAAEPGEDEAPGEGPGEQTGEEPGEEPGGEPAAEEPGEPDGEPGEEPAEPGEEPGPPGIAPGDSDGDAGGDPDDDASDDLGGGAGGDSGLAPGEEPAPGDGDGVEEQP